jgi:uncharacterized protein YbjT (DUF2867 family)
MSILHFCCVQTSSLWEEEITMDHKVLITGATGDTGRSAVRESIKLGLKARALVHSIDDRSKALEALGAEIALGDATILPE